MSSSRDPRGLLFVAPFLLLYAIILVFPLLRGIWLSFTQVDLFGDGHFVGAANYARLAHDPIFATSLLNTFKVTLMIVPALTILALALALALNSAGRGAAVLRGIFFSSAVLSVTIVTLIWRFVLAPDSGLLGEAWKAMGADPLPFLSDARLVLPALALTTIWWSVGLPMLLFLAGLQQIPEDMYEAAALDNASSWTVFAKITVPSLRRRDIERNTVSRASTGAQTERAMALEGNLCVVPLRTWPARRRRTGPMEHRRFDTCPSRATCRARDRCAA